MTLAHRKLVRLGVALTLLAGCGGHSSSRSKSVPQAPVVAAVAFSSTTSSIAEGGPNGQIEVVLSLSPGEVLTAPVRVDVLDTSIGSAAVGLDYQSIVPAALEFPVGSSNGASRFISITVIDDAHGERDETISLQFTIAGGTAALGSQTQHTATITDNDHVLSADSSDQLLDWIDLSSELIGATAGGGLAGITSGEGMAFDSTTGTLFVADDTTDQLFRVDRSTGSRTPVGPFGASSVESLAFDPSTGMLYGVSDSTDTLLSINTKTGLATPFPNALGYSRVEGLAFDPTTGTLYGADNGTDFLITIDTTTGIGATKAQPLSFTSVTGLAFDPATGTLYGCDDRADMLITVDPATGAGTAVGPFGATFGKLDALAFDSTTPPGVGTLLGVDDGVDSLVEVDTGSGTASLRGTLGLVSVDGLARDRANGIVYAVEHGGSRRPTVLLRVDTASGTATSIGFVTGFSDVGALAYNSLTNTLYAVDGTTDTLLVLNTTTGGATPRAQVLGFTDVSGLAFDPNSPPGIGTLYGCDNATDTLITIDPLTGVGTALATPLGFADVTGLTFDPDTPPGVGSLYGIDSALGALIQIDPTSGVGSLIGETGLSAPTGLVFDSTATLLVAADPTAALGRPFLAKVDVTSARTTTHGTLGVRVQCLAHDAGSGVVWGVEEGRQFLVELDPVSGEATLIGPTGFTDVTGLTFDSRAGVLYGCDDATDTLIVVDPATGVGTARPQALGFTQVEGLAFDPSTPPAGGTLFGVDVATQTLIAIDPATGMGTPRPGLLGFADVQSLTFDLDADRLLGASRSAGQILVIDRLAGTATTLRRTLRRGVTALTFRP